MSKLLFLSLTLITFQPVYGQTGAGSSAIAPAGNTTTNPAGMGAGVQATPGIGDPTAPGGATPTSGAIISPSASPGTTNPGGMMNQQRMEDITTPNGNMPVLNDPAIGPRSQNLQDPTYLPGTGVNPNANQPGFNFGAPNSPMTNP